MRDFTYIPAVLLLALLAGCTVGPDYRKPDTKVPAAWVGPTTQPATQAAETAERELADWWTVFDDPTLTSLIERAVQTNLDIRGAEARIRQARAARGLAVSGLGPTVDAGASYRRSQASGANAGRRPPQVNVYDAGFDAGWEIDVFGGVRRGVEAADADLRASVESRRDVLVTLVADVARNYVELRTFQQQIAITRRNLEAQERSARLTRERFEAGFATRLDVANAEAEVATTTSQIPTLESSAQQRIYALSVLLGREPGALLEELSLAAAIPAGPPSVPVGVPSDLLRRRPDIRQAEEAVHSATARIGVAVADLFPKLTLNGSIGFQSGDASNWISPLGRTWSIGPSATWRIFDTGGIQSNIALQRALTEESVILYEQTVLNALQEVENALIASAKEQARRETLVEAVAANRRAVELATTLYTAGETDFLNVLNAQRSLLASENSLAQSDQAVSTNLIALYKALGGGWEMEEGHRRK